MNAAIDEMRSVLNSLGNSFQAFRVKKFFKNDVRVFKELSDLCLERTAMVCANSIMKHLALFIGYAQYKQLSLSNYIFR